MLIENLETWADIVLFTVLILGYIAFLNPVVIYTVQGRMMLSVYSQNQASCFNFLALYLAVQNIISSLITTFSVDGDTDTF